MRPKQQRFADEYLIDLNATQAAIRAGYSPRSAGVTGARLLKNARVRAYVDTRLAEMGRRTGVNQERILRELARIAFVNPPDVVSIENATLKRGASKDDTAAIASVRVKRIPTDVGEGIEREIRFYDKNRALELLGKAFGMWVDRRQTDLTAQVQIVDDVPPAPPEHPTPAERVEGG